MNIKKELAELRKKMAERSIDIYYVPSADPHMCEYLPEHYQSRAFLSGFTGSAGTVVVTADKAGLWTDGRYFLQAEKQLAGSGIDLYKMGEENVPTIPEFIKQLGGKSLRLGVDGKVLSMSAHKAMTDNNPKLEFVMDVDLVGEIWTKRPPLRASEAYILDTKYTGESASSKINRLRKRLDEVDATSTIIGALEDVGYLFNIRANDIKCNPVVTAYALVDKEKAILFVNPKQINGKVKSALESEGITVMAYDDVFTVAEELGGIVYLDPNRTNMYLRNKINTKVLLGKNLTMDMKAKKNETEVENFRKAMLTDGIAMVKILKWVQDNANTGVTEWDVSEKLHSFREEGENFIEDSFDTIAGYGPNGAIVHYGPEAKTASKLQPKSFLLLDSGGHYLTGTTDITRTIPLGELTQEEKENYTYVLKAHIRLAMAKFKAGTTGFALDTICREALWSVGKDFNHGTGHGVGYLLSVHEGPQSISQRYINEPLKVGMITSNEPGLYISGKHGIRIESLVVTKEYMKTEFGSFYEFETLTVCPIMTTPVIKSILNAEEIAWLNDYNAKSKELLMPKLDAEHQKYLSDITKAI